MTKWPVSHEPKKRTLSSFYCCIIVVIIISNFQTYCLGNQSYFLKKRINSIFINFGSLYYRLKLSCSVTSNTFFSFLLIRGHYKFVIIRTNLIFQMAAIFPVLDLYSCIATKWSRHLGFCITYTALLMKTWRCVNKYAMYSKV